MVIAPNAEEIDGVPEIIENTTFVPAKMFESFWAMNTAQ